LNFYSKFEKTKQKKKKIEKGKKGVDYLGRGPLAARGAAPPPRAA
jgi:hypothetical protein